ncbi:hypothetical protein SEVIR_3G384900v4 [Setaria viridis]|uniref:NB-ARC domain-containing protein n=1 Tax=Setaria viridis TaxID=4556 RepID=A0A4V6DAF5_SETVI|nr:hypothetical protein SEVIR_3G384900v2 [Setaria viridis]
MAPAAALVFAGKSVAIPAISFLVNKAFAYLNQYWKTEGIDEMKSRILLALPKIQAVFDVVNPERIKEESIALDAWLWHLRDAVEKAEDAVDEIEYYELKEKAKDLKVSDWGSSFAKMKHSAIKSVKHASIVDKAVKGLSHRGTLRRLQKALEGLDKAAAGVVGFLALADHLGGSTSRQEEDSLNKDRETGSMITATKVFGRRKESEEAIGWLTKPSVGDAEIEVSKVSVVSIVGHGGMGKTTLAQLIHNDDTITRHFDKVIWACVSTTFNATTVIRNILENATWATNGASTLDALQKILREKLDSLKFLVILDDVWEDKTDDQWGKLFAPLRAGKNGSKILLTTRMKGVAEMADQVMRGENKLLELQGLDEDDNIELFSHHAFPSCGLQDDAAFKRTGEQIAKNLRGCPLVTKVVGAHLRDNMRLDYWNEFLMQSLKHFYGGSEDIMDVLKLSYYHLPPVLQTCFRFCSLFPQDYEFQKDQLVEMWVDSGLISQDAFGTQSLVDVGEKYLVQLTRKSFFDLRFRVDLVGQEDRESGYYVMHDLMHDLATNVSFGECLRMVDGGSLENVPSTVRHIRVELIHNFPTEKMKKISCLENLRTIIIVKKIHGVEENIGIRNTVEELVESSKSLRLFQTELQHRSHFASKLAKLKHLRCIILQYTRESMSGVFKLYHLRRLIWRSTKIGSKQVRDVGYLDRLQYVSYGGSGCSMVPVARLTSLRVLKNYHITRIRGYNMSALKDLGSLRSLSVDTLENVDNQEEAKKAKMKEKKCLVSLRLGWTECDGVRSRTDELILDSLEPHANLKKLCISRFRGSRIPHWIAESRVANLVELDFNFCEHIEELPSLGKLLKLKDLTLRGLIRLRRIGQPLNASGDGRMESFLPPSLQKLNIKQCLKLEELPLLPPSLVRLDIQEVGLIRLPRIVKLHISSDESISSKWLHIMVRSCQCLTSLEGSLFEQKQCIQVIREMSIIDCMHLESAPFPFEEMNELREIRIENCPELRLLSGAEDKLPLPSLKTLAMGRCGDLELLLLESLQVFTNLSNLSLRNCSVVESLPSADVFANLTSLRIISLIGCRNLSSLGGLRSLPRLEDLELLNCSKLAEAGLSLSFGVSGCEEEPGSFKQIKDIMIDHPALLLVEPVRSLCPTYRLQIRDGSEMLDAIEPWLLRNCTSLQHLWISKVNLESLPLSLSELSSLETLRLYDSDQLRSLPNVPSSLQTLFIQKCHSELRKKASERGSLEWNKISHIPHVQIGRSTGRAASCI